MDSAFEDGDHISSLYGGNGTKLRATHVIGNATTVTDYYGNVVYESGISKTFLTEAGYVTLPDRKYHYFIQDHQGNNRLVVDQSGGIEEVNDYYPFGGTFADSSSVQPYKYNGKELDRQSGLDWYDYGARMYDAALGRWHVVDPLSEKYYSVSPYVYCANNPIKYIDPTGMFLDDIYHNEKGQEIFRVKKDDPDRLFVIKTTQTTDQMYGKEQSPQKGIANPISSKSAIDTENAIKTGNLVGEHMSNVQEIGSAKALESMMSSIKDNGKGGIADANNKEYYGSFDDKRNAINTGSSASGKPSLGKNLVSGSGDFYSHPSGTEKIVKNGQSYTGSWAQPPSKQDISTSSKRMEIVVGMGNKRIYIYNNKGVVATIPITVIK